ncbi:MAG: type II secretion system F family protein [Aliidiomarina sp.]|uniref:type II secretion system F family protein n=1 Tax=Aliidiomarina sp. TaxID=1872439 RepID=UPI0025C5272F|nr:type II secretion system F family protein [Aliidiomarina sp.]MCH8501430.1 type II secretion system F family protein [Aliidiomarina sp.]
MLDRSVVNRFLEALIYWLRGRTQLDQALLGIVLMSQENSDRRVNRLSRQIRHSSQNGKSLSHSLGRYLAADEQSLLLVGEKSGGLFAALDMIVAGRQKKYQWKRASQRQIAYPLVLVSVSFIVLHIVSGYLLPAVYQIYQDSFAQTAGLEADWVRAYFFMAALLVTGLIAAFTAIQWGQYFPQPMNRFTRMRTVSLLPFCQVLALSLQSKQSVLELLLIAQNNCSVPLRHAFKQVTIRLRQGVSQLEQLLSAGGIPRSILFEVQLLRNEGGREKEIMHKVCERVADYAMARHRSYVKSAVTTCYFFALINTALVVNTLSNAMRLVVQQIV